MKRAIGLFLIAGSSVAAAQVKDTTVRHGFEEITYFTLAEPHHRLWFDSTLTDFHLYPRFRRQDPFSAAIGTNGQAILAPRFDWRRKAEVDAGFHAHAGYLYAHDRIPFYNPPFPFTSLEYVQGLAGEQQIHATHTQNINGRINFGADYQLTGSRGNYDSESANLDNLHLFGRYQTKSGRYGALWSFLLNDVENEVNGGVTENLRTNPDSLFALSLKSTATMRNNNATIKQNHKEIAWYQHLDFGPRVPVAQPGGQDTLLFCARFRVFHRLQLGRMVYSYDDFDLDTNYYADLLLSADSTFDETRHVLFYNTVGVETAEEICMGGKGLDQPFRGSAWVKYTVDEFAQLGHARYYNNVWLGGDAAAQGSGIGRLRVGGVVGVAGSHVGDYQADLRGKTTGQGNVSIEAGVARVSPSFVQTHYFGNHYRWDTTWAKESALRTSAAYRNEDWRLSVQGTLQRINRLLYFDSTGLPSQAIGSIRVMSLEAGHTLHWKALRLRTGVLLQSVQPQTVVDVPTWGSRHTLYFEGSIFKRALSIQAGVDVRLHAPYRTPSFDPITSQFLVQRSYRSSTLPVTDVFVNMRIKKARIFLLLSDATEGLFVPGGYFVVSGYPAGGRSFRFGVSWQFMD